MTKPTIGSRNPDWNDYVPQKNDKVIVTRIAHKGLRPILGETAFIAGFNDLFIHLAMKKPIDGKNIYKVDRDEVLLTKVED